MATSTSAPSAPGDDAAPPSSREVDLSLADALQFAVDLLRASRLDEAERLYNAILANWPEQPDALHFLGVLQNARGDRAAAEQLIRRAIELQPDEAGPWNNLGNVLRQLQRLDEAVAAYERCLALAPDSAHAASAHCNLGVIERKRGRPAAAEAALRKALTLDPDLAEAWYGLSRVLIERGEIHEGLIANSKAITLWPEHLQARGQVIGALVQLGHLERAAELYRAMLAENPDNPVARHHLAGCLGADVPARAPDDYIERVFDDFADAFDRKLAKLGYRAPQLVADALSAHLPPPAQQLDIADVGCGTGLVGPLVRPWARRLVGCDLSVGMLQQAERRACYDVLHKAELVQYLAAQPATFDLITSADTLCYFGDLTAVACAAAAALRPGGALVFTVEALLEHGALPHRLQPNGRYAHAHAHIESVLRSAQLAPLQIARDELRQEAGLAVAGWVVVARRTAA
jgi:predicted TPR repeat methyltransferase